MIHAKQVQKSFGDNSVLKGVDFKVSHGEVVSIIGPSGSGKSTLLRSLIGLEKIDSGDIFIDGEPFVTDGKYANEPECRRICRKMGMVFQHFNLFPHMSVHQNLTIAPQLVKSFSKKQCSEKCAGLLQTVGLSDKLNAMPSSLSGGQKQRVAIARALMMEPEILLFDEPTSALDPELTGEVLEVIRGLAKNHMTMVIVTHEMSFARDVSDRVIFMDNGVVAIDDTPKAVFEATQNERIRQFLRNVS